MMSCVVSGVYVKEAEAAGRFMIWRIERRVTMALTPVRNLQLHQQIERVLHVQGNYRGGILEMAMVVDCEFDRETARQLCADVITSCKKQSEVFRNVRLNLVLWGKEEIRTTAVAAAYVQMGTFFDVYEQEEIPELEYRRKTATEIMEYLKKFQARSKLILLLTPDKEQFDRLPKADRGRMQQALNPFLKQKLILLYPHEMESGTALFLRSCADT